MIKQTPRPFGPMSATDHTNVALVALVMRGAGWQRVSEVVESLRLNGVVASISAVFNACEDLVRLGEADRGSKDGAVVYRVLPGREAYMRGTDSGRFA